MSKENREAPNRFDALIRTIVAFQGVIVSYKTNCWLHGEGIATNHLDVLFPAKLSNAIGLIMYI